jgi:hypothetical protein
MSKCLNEKHYVGEYGTAIYVNCGQDISGASDIKIFIERPDGSILQKTATVEVFQGSNNYVMFMIEDGDFNQIGTYTGQVQLVLGPWRGKGREFTIDVEEGLSSSSSASTSN